MLKSGFESAAVDAVHSMGERSDMQRSIRFTFAATIAAALLAMPVSAAPRSEGTSVVPTDVSAQSRPKKKRPPQITVRPQRFPYATDNTPYPRAYKFHYPGPNAKRHCTARLVLEPRPSGTVLVPRQHCWWARG